MHPKVTDEDCAHYAALKKLSPEDLLNGILIMRKYMHEFLFQTDDYSRFDDEDYTHILDNEPAVGQDFLLKQKLADSFRRFDLQVPHGLNQLPISWAEKIHQTMYETHWPTFPSLTIADVFGWEKITRQGSFIKLKFSKPIPSENVYWPELGDILVKLQMSMG